MPGRGTAARAEREPWWDRVERDRGGVRAFVAVFAASAAISAAALTAAAGVFLGVVLVAPSGTVDYFRILPWVVAAAGAAGAVLAGVHVARALASPREHLLAGLGMASESASVSNEVAALLGEVAAAAGLPRVPDLRILQADDCVEALVVATSREDATIGVTRAMADLLDADELRAVLASLVARVRDGDAHAATVITAVMGPIWARRAEQERHMEEQTAATHADRTLEAEPTAAPAPPDAHDADLGRGLVRFVLGALAVVTVERLLRGRVRAALSAAERGEADGARLLRDPRVMQQAADHILRADHAIPEAEAYSMLVFRPTL